jgi:hypothetical protein
MIVISTTAFPSFSGVTQQAIDLLSLFLNTGVRLRRGLACTYTTKGCFGSSREGEYLRK